ncbi:2Fe-2S iron-sulfur cluster-binding protein [Streptomyces sp. NPDC056821]|uniref:2Fe-2S iron-sulfur cluster-binding protein n=1 Tax=unclassified Streptomyces TaxID=2593676 RepID=UPI00369F844D
MPRVTYVRIDGSSTTLDAQLGTSVMRAATQNRINGIVGECGGNLMCATCHVYVDPAWSGRLRAPDGAEQDMVEEAAAPVKDNSRLSCQIVLGPEHDGLVVHLPEMQVP